MTSTSETATAAFTREQIGTLYRDGFVILRNVVSETHVNEVRRGIFEELGNLRSQAVHAALRPEDFQTRAEYEAVNEAALATLRGGSQPRVLGLFNDTVLISIIEAALGAPVVPVKGAQLATNFPAGPGDTINESGYRDRDTPFHGWVGHLDGLWNGGSRIHQHTDRPMNESERKRWLREVGTNSVPKYNPEHRANIRNFTALIGVALSDQRTEGVGNLGLLKGAHHAIEEFFRWQREAGGPLGPDGPGWPRIDTSAPNFGGLRHYPDAVRDRFAQDAARSEDGKLWPKPTLVCMAPGDAVIALHGVPHSATRVGGFDPRMIAYFRITPRHRPAGNEEVYPDALCDIWAEWRGLSDVVEALKIA